MSNNLLPKPKLIFLSWKVIWGQMEHKRKFPLRFWKQKTFELVFGQVSITNRRQNVRYNHVYSTLLIESYFKMTPWVKGRDIKSYNLPVIFILPLTCSRSRGRFRSWPVNFTHCYPARLMFNWHLDQWPRKIVNYFKVTKNRLKLQGSQKK